jgi:general secretion pathway protein A
MYEEHFGLKSRPFGAKAEGAGVFVGPQQAKIMNSLTKGLGAADAVVTVTGPAGVGKTTIVSRALESISPGRMVAWVGRMQLAPDEVLELLFTGFGVSRETRGTIQRFAAFRRLLGERAAAGAQVAIVVEDAQRIGADALIELEALTAADAGDSTSANIILMGQPGLNKLLATPELARLRQRNRLQQKIEAFSEAEVNGYLKHCIREAGGDYDARFDSGVAKILYKCSEGVPRIINTLCETAMTTAMEDGQPRVTTAMMHKVAADAFGYEGTQSNLVCEIETDAFLTPDPVIEAPRPEDIAETNLPVAESSGDDIPETIEDTNPALEQIDIAIEHDVGEVAVANLEVEATQTQKTLSVSPVDEVIVDAGHADDDAKFSLDAALSVEAEETNVMPGITPNLEQIAAQVKKEDEAANILAVEPTENIPTLSNSMRIDVEVEVQRARETETKLASASEPAAEVPAEPKPELVVTATPATPPQANIDATPEPQPVLVAKPKPVVDTKAEAEPIAAVEPPPEPLPVVDAQPEPEVVVAAEPAPAVDENPEPYPVVAKNAATETGRDPESTVGDVAAELAEQAADAWSHFEDDASNESESVKEVDAEVAVRTLADENLPVAEKPVEAIAVADVTPVAKIGTKKKRREPDIDALEAALTAAKKGDFADQPSAPATRPVESVPEPIAEDTSEAVVDVPQITLEDSLPQANKDDDELRRVAEQIGAANSLEDVSDLMAETIFGSQALDEIAAAVVANPPQEDAESPVMLTGAEVPAAANDGSATAKAAVPVVKAGKVDESAAKRLNMVKALKNGNGSASAPVVEKIEMSSGKPNATPPPKKMTGPQPEPIENQINTSMTQTLKALSSAQIKKAQEPEEEEKKSGGLFGRFRRSS